MHERALMGLCFAALSLAMTEPTEEEKRERLEREAMRTIGEFAKAFGPYASHFGYAQHQATQAKPQSDSLRRMLGGKKRGQFKKAA